MSDTTYFIILVMVFVFVVIVIVYRMLKKPRYSKEGNKANNALQLTTNHMHSKGSDDIITAPGIHSVKSNIYHKDRYGD